MDFLYLVAQLRNPVCDFIFETITHLGEETFFLVLAIVFYWCINKREGYYILFTGLFGTIINQAAKITFRIDRPWVKDPGFQPVGDSKIEATGYSFPSGHTQNVATTWGSIAAYNKKNRVISWISIAIIVLVSFSRLYLGVHTLLDVSVSLVISLILVLCMRPLFATEEKFNKSFPYVVAVAIFMALAFLAYVLAIGNDPTLDAENYHSALKNASTMVGCITGLGLVFIVDTKWTNFETDGKWYAQVIKAAVGFGIVLAIKSGLSAPLTSLFGNEFVARAVRYFLIVAFAGAVWPLTFKWFANLKIAALDKFTDKVRGIFSKAEKN